MNLKHALHCLLRSQQNNSSRQLEALACIKNAMRNTAVPRLGLHSQSVRWTDYDAFTLRATQNKTFVVKHISHTNRLACAKRALHRLRCLRVSRDRGANRMTWVNNQMRCRLTKRCAKHPSGATRPPCAKRALRKIRNANY